MAPSTKWRSSASKACCLAGRRKRSAIAWQSSGGCGRISPKPSASGEPTSDALTFVFDLLGRGEIDQAAGLGIDVLPILDIEIDHCDGAGRELAGQRAAPGG